jgi:hypothetical protein
VLTLDQVIAYLRDEVGAEQQTPNGFTVQVKGSKVAQLSLFVILTAERILFSAPLFETASISAQHALDFTISSPFGLSIIGDSFALKHVFSMEDMSKEKFLEELTFFVAGVEELLPDSR